MVGRLVVIDTDQSGTIGRLDHESECRGIGAPDVEGSRPDRGIDLATDEFLRLPARAPARTEGIREPRRLEVVVADVVGAMHPGAERDDGPGQAGGDIRDGGRGGQRGVGVGGIGVEQAQVQTGEQPALGRGVTDVGDTMLCRGECEAGGPTAQLGEVARSPHPGRVEGGGRERRLGATELRAGGAGEG